MKPSVNELFSGLKSGDRRSLSQSITLIESNLSSDQELADQLMDLCSPLAGSSHRVGITGVPGVGKSTFIESIGMNYIAKGHIVAVLAVDPSSTQTGGSILGDKTRMERLSVESNAFIRPSASAKTLGGVAQKTRESIILCEVAGFDLVLVETVGVGQSETSVRSMVDSFVLLMLAGAGDELQGIKRGIMEMADLLFINKSEEENLAQARRASSDYSSALHMFSQREDGWTTPVELISALTGFNIEKAAIQIKEHYGFLNQNQRLINLRNRQNLSWFDQTLHSEIIAEFLNRTGVQENLAELKDAVKKGLISPISAARKATKS